MENSLKGKFSVVYKSMPVTVTAEYFCNERIESNDMKLWWFLQFIHSLDTRWVILESFRDVQGGREIIKGAVTFSGEA